jgi:hypothetical protein
MQQFLGTIWEDAPKERLREMRRALHKDFNVKTKR